MAYRSGWRGRVPALPCALAVAVVCFPSRVFAQCDPATFGANPADTVPDDWAIQQCLNGGGTTNLISGSSPGYLITNTLLITVAGTTLQGVSTGLSHLKATSALDGSPGKGRILDVNNVNNVTLSHLWFDGDKDTRDTFPCAHGGSFEYGKNLMVSGNFFRIVDVLDEKAVCGSSAEVQGSGFEIANSTFRNNGYPEDSGAQSFADGLTVWHCYGNSSIHNNGFFNNTDIDLVVGGGGGGTCSVINNTISNTTAHAFAGIHIGQFDGIGDHSKVTYSGNTITAATNMLAFGLMVGFHPWDMQSNIASVGSVTGNNVSGAVINLQIEADSRGIATGQVTANPVSSAQGNYAFGNCPVSTNYAAYPPHAGAISYDPGYLNLQYDNQTCTLR